MILIEYMFYFSLVVAVLGGILLIANAILK